MFMTVLPLERWKAGQRKLPFPEVQALLCAGLAISKLYFAPFL